MPTNKRNEASVREPQERKAVTKCRKLVVITSVDNSDMSSARAVIPQLCFGVRSNPTVAKVSWTVTGI